jgi:hypothetical protein
MGLVIGGGLVFTLNFVYDVLTPRTITTTWTETSIVVITIPSTITTTGYAQIEPSVTSCAWNGAHEFCVVVLKNFGNMGTATSGNCSLSYGGSTYAGYTGPTQASAAHPGAAQQLVPGSTVTTYCQASAGGAAGAAAQVNGSIALANGATVSFSTTASS